MGQMSDVETERSPAWRLGVFARRNRDGRAKECQHPREHPKSLLARNKSLEHPAADLEVSGHRFSMPREVLCKHPAFWQKT